MSLQPFGHHDDIGPIRFPGSVNYDPVTQAYTISGSGADMWSREDSFHFLWRRLKGNFILSTRARFVGKGNARRRKLGWIVRSSLEGTSRHVCAALHGDGLLALQFRRHDGDRTREIRSPLRGPDFLQLERRGDSFRMSAARFGDTLSGTDIPGVPLGEEVYVGLFVCSHDERTVESGEFRDVRVVVPPKDGFVPYTDYIGSLLEILDLKSGQRSVLFRSPDSIQAPNWTPDGKALIYNCNGRLYRFDLASRKPDLLDTGFATANNNDHVLSFDGKMIGISHHSAEDENKSIVYSLPAGGGVPKKITRNGPSYLHGWSPDGRYLVYTAGRNGLFNIYRIPATGGDEVRLTTTEGLDDGPEYDPTGRYIYFNSNRSGRMQLWRMNADGGDQQQITHDEYNNWFPHVSPDGKQIVFLTFGPEIDPAEHPFYKNVYIRLMPASGGEASVLAYVYGGQGTINVPSWSPDSRKIAFVSNSDLYIDG